MLSISLGPVALSVLPLVLMLAVRVAASLAWRFARNDFSISAENRVWGAAALGLLAARLTHVARYADAYLATPGGVGRHPRWRLGCPRAGASGRLTGLPTTLFFDAKGQRVDAPFGMLNAAALQVQLDRLRGR